MQTVVATSPTSDAKQWASNLRSPNSLKMVESPATTNLSSSVQASNLDKSIRKYSTVSNMPSYFPNQNAATTGKQPTGTRPTSSSGHYPQPLPQPPPPDQQNLNHHRPGSYTHPNHRTKSNSVNNRTNNLNHNDTTHNNSTGKTST
jgi:hypothetical protein